MKSIVTMTLVGAAVVLLLNGCYATSGGSGYYNPGLGHYGHGAQGLEPVIAGNAGPGFRTYTGQNGRIITCGTYGEDSVSATNCW